MEKKNSRLAIRIDDDKYHALKIAAAFRNVSISQFVMEAIGEKILKDNYGTENRPHWFKSG